MTRRSDDLEFSEEFLAGDIEAFRRFFRTTSPEVVALCRRILGNVQDAEDVAADVFLEIWSHRDRFDSARGTLRSYVLMLARSRAIDLYRVKARERVHVASTQGQSVDCVGPDQTAIEDVSMKEFQMLASNALAELGETEKAAIELAFFQGLSHSQIASQLNSPLGTIKSNIRRGLSKLRQKLQEWES